MTSQQPTQWFSIRLHWVGFVFFWVTASVIAQTPIPQSQVKEPSTTPTVAPTPSAPIIENGTQLVRKAESTIKTTGNAYQAIGLYETAAQAFHRTGDFESEALSWHRVAQLSSQAGYLLQAKNAAEKARMVLRVRTLPTHSVAGVSIGIAARAYLTLGRIHLESGEVKESVDAYQAGLQSALNAKLPRESAAGYVALGRIASDADELDVAIRMTGSSLEFWREARDFNGEAIALNNMARYYERKGDLNLAASFDEQAIQVTRFVRNYRGEKDSLNEAMRIQLMLGNYAEAAQICEQAIGLSRLQGEKKSESDLTLSLAVIEAQRNNIASAYQLLLRALIVGATHDAELASQVKEFKAKLAAIQQPISNQREQLIAEAEFESKRGDYGAAYQLLLRALLMNEGKSDATNVPINAWIKSLVRQIEDQQKTLKPLRQ